MSPRSQTHADAAVRAADAWMRADARLAGAVDDLFLAEDARLDDRARAMVHQALAAMVARVEVDLRRHAARVLAGVGAPTQAEAMLTGGSVFDRLARAGLLRDLDLIDDLLARVRLDVLAEALPTALGAPDAASLLVRLSEAPDGVVARAATNLLAADSRRGTAMADGGIEPAALPAEVQHRLVWRVAAALRDGDDTATDRAIAQAALRSLGAYDEDDRAEAAAMRLAAAIDATPAELAPLAVEALGDRRLSFFVALLAHALAMDHDQVRAMVIEPEGERLWLALRALDLDRPTIAQIALALADADPRRDIEAFADRLDGIVAVPPAEAAAALAPFALDRDFRAAMRALARSERR